MQIEIEKVEQLRKEEDTTYNKKVVVFNDNFNTFEHVIGLLCKYCDMDTEKAIRHTLEIHYSGRSIVYTNADEYRVDYVRHALSANGLSAKCE